MASCRIRYLNVPHQSTLLLSTESDGAYQAQAVVFCDSTDSIHFGKTDLDPGPADSQISAPCIYVARIKIQITGNNTNSVTIKTRVMRSNGKPYSTTKTCTFLKTDGNTHFSQVMIVTEPEQ